MSGFGATLECAPGAGQVEVSDLTGWAGRRWGRAFWAVSRRCGGWANIPAALSV